MRVSRTIIAIVLLVSPYLVQANTGVLDSTSTIGALNLLITQYEARIKQLESENNVLKNEMVKAGIKIPLSEYSGAIASPLPASFPSTPLTTSVVATGTVVTPVTSLPTTSVVTGPTLSEITTKYGKDASGFISRINTDWKAIKDFYKLPALTKLAGYEFVQSGSNDHVFVDLVVGTGTTGIYDMKLLYQYKKSEYKRKLIGMFQYNAETGRYITLQGTNPFAGTVRTFVRDPYFIGSISLPVTAGGASTTPVVSTSTGSTVPITSTSGAPTTVVGTVILADITKAYSEKKYLSTITLSNTFLEKNKPTAEILNIRYRTYFIIGKYTESLAEVAKMEAIGALDRQTACNAQVIATYSKNTALVTKYTAVCKK